MWTEAPCGALFFVRDGDDIKATVFFTTEDTKITETGTEWRPARERRDGQYKKNGVPEDPVKEAAAPSDG